MADDEQQAAGGGASGGVGILAGVALREVLLPMCVGRGGEGRTGWHCVVGVQWLSARCLD